MRGSLDISAISVCAAYDWHGHAPAVNVVARVPGLGRRDGPSEGLAVVVFVRGSDALVAGRHADVLFNPQVGLTCLGYRRVGLRGLVSRDELRAAVGDAVQALYVGGDIGVALDRKS